MKGTGRNGRDEFSWLSIFIGRHAVNLDALQTKADSQQFCTIIQLASNAPHLKLHIKGISIAQNLRNIENVLRVRTPVVHF